MNEEVVYRQRRSCDHRSGGPEKPSPPERLCPDRTPVSRDCCHLAGGGQGCAGHPPPPPSPPQNHPVKITMWRSGNPVREKPGSVKTPPRGRGGGNPQGPPMGEPTGLLETWRCPTAPLQDLRGLDGQWGRWTGGISGEITLPQSSAGCLSFFIHV